MHFGDTSSAPAPGNALFTPLELGLGLVATWLVTRKKKSTKALGLAAAAGAAVSLVSRKRTQGGGQDLVSPVAGYRGRDRLRGAISPRMRAQLERGYYGGRG